jgi:high-affinity nickel-transport protein
LFAMLGSIGLVLLGFLLGVRHALDPDHVVAIGTISTSAPSVRRSVAIGALWGLGHTLTVLAVGGAIVLFRTAVSPRAALAMEFSVALMLIALGLLNLLSARRAEPAAPSAVRPLVVGMVHGMAGSAAIALLVMATIREPAVSVAYLLLPSATVFASMGRTVSRLDENGSSLVLGAGVSVGFQRRLARR